MLNPITETKVSSSMLESELSGPKKAMDDYRDILKSFELDYVTSGLYWQVGEIDKVQGWIIDISVVVIELESLLKNLIPLLIYERIPFKIAKNKRTARCLIDGNLGNEQMGKVISIYPNDDAEAVKLARKLIDLTAGYKGPGILTDINLGGIVYTRYGGFKPILINGINGKEEAYILDGNGNQVKESYSTPFKLPSGVTWPFDEITKPTLPIQKKILKGIYKPISVLKDDARGNVIKALYVKGILQVGYCVIKEGRKNMIVDDFGRDVSKRLLWQKEIEENMRGIVPFPKILDCFEDNGNMYLVMEYIKGTSLFDHVLEINGSYKSFYQLSTSHQVLLLHYLVRIIHHIGKLHENGYIHRDITPANFLITEKNEIVLIDIELAYHVTKGKDLPPYELGTPGFMSPEQDDSLVPTIKEDIYSLGALIIYVLSGISPLKFDNADSCALFENLNFFIGNRELSSIVVKCLNREPSLRPDLKQLETVLTGQIEMFKHTSSVAAPDHEEELSLSTLKPLLKQAIDGLNKHPMPISHGIWMSKTANIGSPSGTDQKDYSYYAGLHTGLSGVLYLLARATYVGYSLGELNENYQKSWRFILRNYTTNIQSLGPGLYNGAAGIALSMATGIRSGLLEPRRELVSLMHSCLTVSTTDNYIFQGLSGQGIALLQCADFLEKPLVDDILDGIVSNLLNSQEKNGTWVMEVKDSKKSDSLPIGLPQGISGICYFLLEVYHRNETEKLRTGILKPLYWLVKKTNGLQSLFDRLAYERIIAANEQNCDQRIGIILTFIKAYEYLKNEEFKNIAERALGNYPDFVVNNNISQDEGLSGLGELYIEAWRVFGDLRWKQRANNIAQIFMHTTNGRTRDLCFWMTDETIKPSVDLMVGNCGIIHFLLRCQNPDTLKHIIFN